MSITWQSASLEINGYSYQELNMSAGQANVFYAINRSTNDIYVSIGSIPRVDNYEKIIKGNASELFGRPTPTNRVAFLNPNYEKAYLTVWYAYTDNFDFSIMKETTVNLGGEVANAIKYDGKITGVAGGVTLPVSGTLLSSIDSTLKSMHTLQQQETTANAAILEGINTILGSL